MAGGRDYGDTEYYMKSVEILDIEKMTWQRGQDLPNGIFGAALVPSNDKNMAYLLGGYSSDWYLDSIYTLKAGLEGDWEIVGYIQQKRDYLAAVTLTPNFFPECT